MADEHSADPSSMPKPGSGGANERLASIKHNFQRCGEHVKNYYRGGIGRLVAYWQAALKKGTWYWLRLAFFLALGCTLSFRAEHSSLWLGLRYHVYQYFQGFFARQPPHKDTVILLIGDDEYWKEGLRRVPFRRDYIAKLLKQLDDAGAAVVVIDIELRAPLPDTPPGLPLEPGEYQPETEGLVSAINNMSRILHIVVPKTVNRRNGGWVHEPDVVDNSQFTNPRVVRGYVVLPEEKWHIPTSLNLSDGPLDSVALAAAKARDASLSDFLQKLPAKAELPFAGYLEKQELEKNVVRAGPFLADPYRYRQEIACKVVLVGGGWSSLAYKRGGLVDLHETPAGPMTGVFIQANYVEAFLDRRIYTRESEATTLVAEALLVIFIALRFMQEGFWRKTRSLAVALAIGAGLGYFEFTNRGVFFDPVFPILAIALHASLEQILEWKSKASLYDRWRKSRGQDFKGSTREEVPA